MKDFFKKLWAVIYNRVVVNWKTTVGGIISVILGWLFFDGVISADVVGVVIFHYNLLVMRWRMDHRAALGLPGSPNRPIPRTAPWFPPWDPWSCPWRARPS